MGHAEVAGRPPGRKLAAVGSLVVRIRRGPENSRIDTFEVPRQADQTVLDVVTHVQRHLDPTLAYRFACRVGMCGSCAMMVNGRPRWTCRSHVAKAAERNELFLEPLRNMTLIKDLAVDMSGFFDKHAKAMAYFAPPQTPQADFAVVPPADPRRAAADEALECIGCGVCHAACDVVAWRPDYLGPAALNRAWTLENDVRDAARLDRLRAVAGDAGCHACHSHESCRAYCPKHLNPTASIAGLKRRVAWAALQGDL